MAQAWHTSRLTAYAPKESKDFIKFDKLQHREKAKDSPADWRDKLAQVRSWVGGFKKRG